MARMKGLYPQLPSHLKHFLAHLDDPVPTVPKHSVPLPAMRHFRSDGVDRDTMILAFEDGAGMLRKARLPMEHHLYLQLLNMVALAYGLHDVATTRDRLYGGANVPAELADRWIALAFETLSLEAM